MFDDPDWVFPFWEGEDSDPYGDLSARMGQSLGDLEPCFDQQLWPLSAVASWVQQRTREAANRRLIKRHTLVETLVGIRRALQAGDITAQGIFGSDPTLRKISKETWSVYVLVGQSLSSHIIGGPQVEGPILLFAQIDGGDGGRQELRHLNFDSREVQVVWPGRDAVTSQPGTAGSESKARVWLFALMTGSPDNPRPKATIFAEAKARFTSLSRRGFERAWQDAVRQSGANSWSQPGRRRRA